MSGEASRSPQTTAQLPGKRTVFPEDGSSSRGVGTSSREIAVNPRRSTLRLEKQPGLRGRRLNFQEGGPFSPDDSSSSRESP
jgi:hypothetical protein